MPQHFEPWAAYLLGNWAVQSTLILGLGVALTALPRVSAGVRHSLALGALLLAALAPLALAVPHPVAARIDAPKVVRSFSMRPSSSGGHRAKAGAPVSANPGDPRLATLIALGWAAGCALRLLWLLGGSVQVAAWLRRSSRVDVRRLAENAGYEVADLEVRTTADLARPAVAGVLRPAILLPLALYERADESLRPVLLHEGAHYRRRDPLRLLLAEAAGAVLFWHPFAWLLRRQLDRLAEEACDREVLAKGVAPGDYARTLLELLAPPAAPRIPLACSLGRAGRELQRRIDALFHARRQPSAAGGVFAALLVVPALAGALSVETGVRPHALRSASKPKVVRLSVVSPIETSHVTRVTVRAKTAPLPAVSRTASRTTSLPALASALRLAHLEPALATALSREPISGRVVVFLLDISSSMRPYQEAARRDLLDRVAALHPGDSFNVVAFATEQHRFAPEPIPADGITAAAIEAWLTTLPEASGTCPLPALEHALATPSASAVVLISDKQTATGALGAQVENLVRERSTAHVTVLAVTLGEAATSGVTGVPSPMGIVERIVAAEEVAAPL